MLTALLSLGFLCTAILWDGKVQANFSHLILRSLSNFFGSAFVYHPVVLDTAFIGITRRSESFPLVSLKFGLGFFRVQIQYESTLTAF